MKQLMIFVFPTLIIIILGIALINATNKTSSSSPASPQAGQAQDMSSMHQAQASDNTAFSALLNKEAPDFTLPDINGKTIHLKDLRGKKVVLFFTEGIMCYPACWNQIAALGKDNRLNSNNIVSLSITVDQASDWQNALKQMPDLASGTVLTDTNRTIVSQYGVLTLDSSMHKGQFPGHTYVLIDTQGVIRYEYDDPQMGVRNDQLVQELGKIQ